MKTIYLFTEKGWTPFDFDAESTRGELSKRNISIGDEATIGNGATIGNEATIGNGARIGDGATIIKSIFITGTRNTVNWYGAGVIHIGCHKKEISWWKKNYKIIGEKEGYSSDEILEYYGYIKVCETLQKSIELTPGETNQH